MGEPLFNVVAVSIANGATRVIAENKTRANAEAILRMAVGRRGVEEEYYNIVPR